MFRWDNDQTTLEQCVTHLASIFIHRSESKSFAFVGTVYRGLLLLRSDLETYTVNKSFLLTALQYTALCIYRIRNKLNISSISVILWAHEILFMPLCAFQVPSIRRSIQQETGPRAA